MTKNDVMKVVQRVMVLGCVCLLAACVTYTETNGVEKEEVSDEDRAKVHTKAAAQYLQKREPEFAKRHLGTAMELEPESPRVHELLALTFLMTGEVDKVEEHYEKMSKYGPDYTRGHYNYAIFLMGQKKYAKARRELNLAEKDSLYEGRAKVFRLLGFIDLEENKDVKSAISNFEKSIQINRADISSMSELALLEWDNSEYEKAKYWHNRIESLRSVKNYGAPSPKHLLMSIRLAYREGDENKQASAELALRNLYPNSPQYAQYKREFRK